MKGIIPTNKALFLNIALQEKINDKSDNSLNWHLLNKF